MRGSSHLLFEPAKKGTRFSIMFWWLFLFLNGSTPSLASLRAAFLSCVRCICCHMTSISLTIRFHSTFITSSSTREGVCPHEGASAALVSGARRRGRVRWLEAPHGPT